MKVTDGIGVYFLVYEFTKGIDARHFGFAVLTNAHAAILIAAGDVELYEIFRLRLGKICLKA